MVEAFLRIYDRTINRNVGIRRIGISFENVDEIDYVQMSLFKNQHEIDKERKLELVINEIKNKMGENTIIRGMDLEQGATTIIRNRLIGGHNGG